MQGETSGQAEPLYADEFHYNVRNLCIKGADGTWELPKIIADDELDDAVPFDDLLSLGQ